MNQITQQVYEFDRFRLEVANRRLLREGEPVLLSPKAFDVLVVLVTHHGELLDKDRLMQMLWPDSFVEEANLPQNISALRKALGESPNQRKFIVTIPGKGYKFAAEVKALQSVEEIVILERHARATITVQELECEEKESNEQILRSEPSPAQPRQLLTTQWLVLFGLMVTVAAALFFLFYRQPTASSPTAIQSIAVLPFEMVAADRRDPDLEYLCDGITDTLTNSLSQLPGLKVMSRNSVLRYKGSETDAQVVGKQLGVQAVLTGRVVPKSDGFSISIELVDARDNSHLWGEQYDRKLSDLLAVQTGLARDISQQLRLKLSIGTP